MRVFVLGWLFGVGAVCVIGFDGVVTLTCRVAPLVVAPWAC